MQKFYYYYFFFTDFLTNNYIIENLKKRSKIPSELKSQQNKIIILNLALSII